MVKGYKKRTLKRRIANYYQLYERMPQITNIKRNANQNNLEVSCHTQQSGKDDKGWEESMLNTFWEDSHIGILLGLWIGTTIWENNLKLCK